MTEYRIYKLRVTSVLIKSQAIFLHDLINKGLVKKASWFPRILIKTCWTNLWNADSAVFLLLIDVNLRYIIVFGTQGTNNSGFTGLGWCKYQLLTAYSGWRKYQIFTAYLLKYILIINIRYLLLICSSTIMNLCFYRSTNFSY